jgi:hypothetical protein
MTYGGRGEMFWGEKGRLGKKIASERKQREAKGNFLFPPRLVGLA